MEPLKENPNWQNIVVLSLDYIGEGMVFLHAIMYRFVGNMLHQNGYFHRLLHDYKLSHIHIYMIIVCRPLWAIFEFFVGLIWAKILLIQGCIYKKQTLHYESGHTKFILQHTTDRTYA